MTQAHTQDFPDGIDEKHSDPQRGHFGGWIPLIVLGALLGIALLGFLGGGPDPMRAVDTPAARLEVTAPTILRNGEFLEIRIRATSRQAIAKPVLAVSSGYWRHLTINTMIPAPTGETFEEGQFHFEFEPLAAGKSLEVKIDGQINPARLGGTHGVVSLLDDKTPLAELPVQLKVLP